MSEHLEFARQLALLAEAEILPRYRLAAVERKADGSEVTEADRAAERAIRAAIGQRYPDHAILGEEFGEAATEHRYSWVIDPLDGTRWFALGVPLFGTLVALLEDDEPILGVIHMPVSGETVFAERSGGCWFATRDASPKRVRVSPVSSLSEASVSASGLHATSLEPAAGHADVPLDRVIRGAGSFRFCGDCLQHSLVCRGVLHAAVDTIMAPWDIAAIVPCIREAGGVVSNLEGQRNDLLHGGSLVTSAGESLHRELLEHLARG